jgi:hypothetical protein
MVIIRAIYILPYFLVRSQPATLLTKFMTCKKQQTELVLSRHLVNKFTCHEGWLKSQKSPKTYLHNCSLNLKEMQMFEIKIINMKIFNQEINLCFNLRWNMLHSKLAKSRRISLSRRRRRSSIRSGKPVWQEMMVAENIKRHLWITNCHFITHIVCFFT